MVEGIKLTFYSLAPYLKGEIGHQWTYHLSVEKSVSRLNFSHVALISKSCSIANLPKHWKRYFHWKDPFRCNISSIFLRLLDFCRLFGSSSSSHRFFFLEAFGTTDLATLTLAATLFAKKKDLIGILFRYPLKRLPRNGTFHLFFAKLLLWKLQKRCFFMSDSQQVARELENRLHHSVTVMPIPHGYPFKHSFSKTIEAKIIFWWPGSPRKEKGLATMQHLLKNTFPFPRQLEIRVSEEMPLKTYTLPVVRLKRSLSKEEYQQLFHECDIVLLPYDPLIYSASTSGIFVEAVALGKIPLVNQKTWAAFELEKYNLEELIVDWNRPDFFPYACQLKEDAQLKSKLKKMQEDYQGFHNEHSFANALEKMLNKKQLSS